MEIKTKDNFVMISYESLHAIKELAYQVTRFAPTYFTYNKRLNSILKSADKVLRIGDNKKEDKNDGISKG